MMNSLSKTQTFNPGDGGPPYRCGVGLVVFNRHGQVLGCIRSAQKNDIRHEGDPMQWPQGGIDEGEDEETAAYRELFEEVGIRREQVQLLARAPRHTYYDFPDAVQQQWADSGKPLKYRGQRHSWFAFLLLDDNYTFSFNHHGEVEFERAEWVDLDTVPARVFSAKQAAYRQAADMFRPLAESFVKKKVRDVWLALPPRNILNRRWALSVPPIS